MFRALTLRFSATACLLVGLALLAPAAQAARTILVFGDSLSAGYGISQQAAWPTLLAQRLREKKLDYTVVNASISGETTIGGRTRLDAALAKYAPQIVIIALGANDGLRGLPLAGMRDNLAAMTTKAQGANAKVLIVGQRLPPNYGAYAQQFQQVYGEVARARKAAAVDFLLDGIATRADLFQADNLHPTAEAQPHLLDNVWRGLEPLLK
jgi:acyl-CoA thioesterase-1